MQLTRESFDNAKEKANKRLNEWIQSVKKEKRPIIGIPRLHLEFGEVFKKIEWKPRSDKLSERKGHAFSFESKTSRRRTNEPRSSGNEKKLSTGTRGRSSIPRNLYLEDHQIYDSNSSNLSSSLEHREEIGKRSGYTTTVPGTPINRTPYPIGNTAEVKGVESLESPEHTLIKKEPEFSKKRESISLYNKPIQAILKKRWRRKTKADLGLAKLKMKDRLKEIEDESKASEAIPATRKKSSVHEIEGGRPKSSSTCIKVNYTTKKGIELVFRRSHKGPKVAKLSNQSEHDVSNLTQFKEETSEERRAEILEHFRRLVRLLIHVRVLLNVSRLRIEEEEKSKEFKRIDGDHELSFDLGMYKTAFSCGCLNARIRRALKKNPEDRNEEDANMLMEVMLRMPVFIKYPVRVRQWLARQMWYDCFQDGRVIIKQGDPGSRMYFVVSGEIDLIRTNVSPTGEEDSYLLRTLTAGATFGEIALIRNMNREFTAICKGTSEFLSLSKTEFNNALRHRWEQEYNIRFNFFRSCDIFESWTDKQLQVYADSSELKEYKDKKVILGDTDRLTDSVYFIRKGRCDVVRRIVVTRHQSPYLRPNLYLDCHERRREQFLNKPYGRSRRIHGKEVHFLTVTTLHPGNYFGAGECLRDTFILSRGKTECVVTNPAQFSIQGKSEQLRTLARDRESILPSNQSLYQQFQINRRWYEYRDKLLRQIYKNKAPNSSLADVPRTIKNEPRIPDDLINY